MAIRLKAPLEDQEQVALFKWAALQSGTLPELDMLAAVPNGGFRKMATAVRLKQTGVKAGYPDLILDVPRRGFHGLRIEMKRINASPSDVSEEQAAWLERLRAQGYKAEVCKGWLAARDLLLWYLGVTE